MADNGAEKESKSGTYEVGYKKPPAEYRFKPGQSGNPKGRPKGARNKPKMQAPPAMQLQNLILEEAYRDVEAKDGDRVIRLPIAQLALRSLGAKAAKGDHRSQRLFAELVRDSEQQAKNEKIELLETWITYRQEWSQVLRERETKGLPPPDPMPLPHPDDVHIDFFSGDVTFRGPICPEQQEPLDGAIHHLEGILDEIEYFEKELSNGPQPPNEDGTVIEPEVWAKWLAEERERLRCFMDRMERIAEKWPRHWPPDHLRHRLPLEWRFRNLKPGTKIFRQMIEDSDTNSQ